MNVYFKVYTSFLSALMIRPVARTRLTLPSELKV